MCVCHVDWLMFSAPVMFLFFWLFWKFVWLDGFGGGGSSLFAGPARLWWLLKDKMGDNPVCVYKEE